MGSHKRPFLHRRCHQICIYQRRSHRTIAMGILVCHRRTMSSQWTSTEYIIYSKTLGSAGDISLFRLSQRCNRKCEEISTKTFTSYSGDNAKILDFSSFSYHQDKY